MLALSRNGVSGLVLMLVGGLRAAELLLTLLLRLLLDVYAEQCVRKLKRKLRGTTSIREYAAIAMELDRRLKLLRDGTTSNLDYRIELWTKALRLYLETANIERVCDVLVQAQRFNNHAGTYSLAFHSQFYWSMGAKSNVLHYHHALLAAFAAVREHLNASNPPPLKILTLVNEYAAFWGGSSSKLILRGGPSMAPFTYGFVKALLHLKCVPSQVFAVGGLNALIAAWMILVMTDQDDDEAPVLDQFSTSPSLPKEKHRRSVTRPLLHPPSSYAKPKHSTLMLPNAPQDTFHPSKPPSWETATASVGSTQLLLFEDDDKILGLIRALQSADSWKHNTQKAYILSVLRAMLGDATLLDYSHLCQRRVLNLVPASKTSVFNHTTAPNMSLITAILACTYPDLLVESRVSHYTNVDYMMEAEPSFMTVCVQDAEGTEQWGSSVLRAARYLTSASDVGRVGRPADTLQGTPAKEVVENMMYLRSLLESVRRDLALRYGRSVGPPADPPKGIVIVPQVRMARGDVAAGVQEAFQHACLLKCRHNMDQAVCSLVEAASSSIDLWSR